MSAGYAYLEVEIERIASAAGSVDARWREIKDADISSTDSPLVRLLAMLRFNTEQRCIHLIIQEWLRVVAQTCLSSQPLDDTTWKHNHRAMTIKPLPILAAVFAVATIGCAVGYQAMGGIRIDKDGVLHEPFGFIPLGYLNATGALVTGTIALINSRKRRDS